MANFVTISKLQVLDLLAEAGHSKEDFFSEFGEHPYYFEVEVIEWIISTNT